MLSDRRQIVLRALIEEYVARALPVGSRTLVENYHLGYSSATIRNELSRLEGEGYLTHPHTSAGRVPTDYGYRAFVDQLLEGVSAGSQTEQDVARLRKAASRVDDLFEKTSQALTEFTDCLALVLPPRVMRVQVSAVNLVMLSDHRLVMVVVTDDGRVLNRQVETNEQIDPAELLRMQNSLNQLVAGTSISRDAHEIQQAMTQTSDPLLARILGELRDCITGYRDHRAYALGMANLMAQPEFSSSAKVTPILAELEDDTMLLRFMNEVAEHEGPIVRIGHENDTEAFADVSVVASRFGEGDRMGLVAILGPTRMDYSRVLRAVRAAKGALDE